MVGFFYVLHMFLIIYLDVHYGGPFLCSTRLPLVVLLLYWAGLPPAVLGPSVLSKGVETGPTETQLGLAYAQTIPRLSGACLR